MMKPAFDQMFVCCASDVESWEGEAVGGGVAADREAVRRWGRFRDEAPGRERRQRLRRQGARARVPVVLR